MGLLDFLSGMFSKSNEDVENDDVVSDEELDEDVICPGCGEIADRIGDDYWECPSCYWNSDYELHVDVYKCDSCDVYLVEDSVEHFVCPSCGYEATLEEIYELEDEKEEEENYRFFFPDADEDEDDEMPECCKACGGPWPNCEDSCNIFDDD